jgi:DNA-binding transcriptional MerR regulator
VDRKRGRRLFYKIGEVCAEFGIEPHVLRYWESEFAQLRPRKNKAGQRIYSPRDIELIRQIKHLLYDRKYRIEGARKALAEEEIAVPEAVPTRPERPDPAQTLRTLRAELLALRDRLSRPPKP